MSPAARLGLVAVVGVAIAVAVVATGDDTVPEPRHAVADAKLRDAETGVKATPVAATDAAGDLAEPIDADGSTQRTAVPSPEEPLSPRAEALFARARERDRVFATMAEVVATGPIAPAPFTAGVLQQLVSLRLLGRQTHRQLREFEVVTLSHCPQASEELFGCSIPFGRLVPGQVRKFVLSPPVDAYRLSFMTANGLWLVMAGPPCARPPSLLDVVPPSLHGHLGRAGRSVFRGRVLRVGRRAGLATGARVGLPASALTVDVQVLDVAQGFVWSKGDVAELVDGSAVPNRFRPMVEAEPVPDGLLRPGAQAWFAADWVLLGGVMWAVEVLD